MSDVIALPASTSSLLVRTDFADDAAWERLRRAVLTENEDGFRAYLEFVEDHANDGVSWNHLRDRVPSGTPRASVLFIADSLALAEADHPIQVVDLSDERRPPFRCVVAELWAVDNNLNLGNMDWEEFSTHTDPDGMYRGLP